MGLKPFKPGERPVGRAKGTPNKTTATLKDMILAALDRKGGVDYLEAQAEANPTAFLTLIGKVLPTELSGPDGGPIQTTSVDLSSLTEEQKRAVIEKVSAALVEAVGAPIANVRVWITEVPKENWGIAGVTAKDLGR